MNIVLASAMAVGIALSATAASAPLPVHAAPTASVTAVKPASTTPAKPVVKPATPAVKASPAKPAVKAPAAPAKPAVPAKPAAPAKPVVKPGLYKGVTAPTAVMQAEAWNNFSTESFTSDELSRGFGATYIGTTTNTDLLPDGHDWYFEDSVSKAGVYHVFELKFK